MKYFIITVDTEGDNLWNYKPGDEVSTKNADYIPRFQRLCEKYGFKPVYLTNYEMLNCERFVDDARDWLAVGNCEIGIHLHAWNNPPHYSIKEIFTGNPYLIEYPEYIMRDKFSVVYSMIKEKFGIIPISHRAGRWAMDERYFNILKDFGVKVDCSHTPGINWSKAKGSTRGGSNYTNANPLPSFINGVMEVPPTIAKFNVIHKGGWKHRAKALFLGENVWLRPATSSLQDMIQLLNKKYRDNDTDYVEFMIHSSELMPGGSPYFKTDEDVEYEYVVMEKLFEYASSLGYVGCTLTEYYNTHNN